MLAAVLLGLPLAYPAACQTDPPSPGEPDPALAHPVSSFPRLVLRDQGRIFVSPSRARPRDFAWLVPLTTTLSFLAVSDRRNMQERIHTNAAARDRSLTVSTVGTGSLMAIPAFLYWKGWHTGDDYTRGTAILAARAVADTAIAAEILRVAVRRERPGRNNASGDFFRGSAFSSSFPSMHSGISWAAASVVAERYPGWLTKTLVYGLAGAVSLSRVTSYQHFPSDVVAGSALGWLIGHYLGRTDGGDHPAYRPERWYDRAPATRTAEPRQIAQVQSAPQHAAPASSAPRPPADEPYSGPAGSSYVPLDSWIYGALDRLAAFGLVPSQTSGLRPWTRDECLRQVREADVNLEAAGGSGFVAEASDLVAALRRELESETGSSGVVLESVYVRNGVIAGPALNDSFHFGQTWTNDSGRPYGQGWNSYEGFTARAESRRFFAYVQGEYQQAPGRDPYSLEVRQTISTLDGTPLREAVPHSNTNRFRLLDTYAGARLGNLQFSVGKQSMWWGPTYDAPLSFSNNAEPTKNLKISTVNPIRLPGFLGYLGDIRGEFAIGKLGGHSYTWRPWFNAQKLSFKLTENLEMGFTRWSIFWGVGHPITLRSFIRNFTSTNSPNGAVGVGASDPGDRKGGFDFRYRVPGLRNWLTIYTDSYADDDPSPLANTRRAAINPGLYLARVPGIPRLDFRVEAPSTTPMDGGWDHPGLNYTNGQYRSGNTNYGYLLGNSVGRDGRAIQAWTAYHFSPRNRVELGYRQVKGSPKFLSGGSTQSGAMLKTSIDLGRNWYTGVQFQYERFWVPVLGGPRRNLSGLLQLTWEPKLRLLGNN